MAEDRIATHDTAAAAAAGEAKRRHGQFFTMVNLFTHPAFSAWLDAVGPNATFVEPFAGANNLVRMVDDVRPGLRWRSYDIEPQHPDVVRRDTLRSFPRQRGTTAVVTNPPYLAKNVARRCGLDDVADACGTFENLYMVCIDRCLANAGHVAAIIPESFLTAGVLTERLETVISVDHPMFVDTDVPVCLALWGPNPCDDFDVWTGTRQLGTWRALRGAYPTGDDDRIVFNDPRGPIGLLAVDKPSGATIAFVAGSTIPACEVKPSSRHRTRITIAGLDPAQCAAVIDAANARLARLRIESCDVGLTAFMGLRADGTYRRRLDYATARSLLAEALAEVESASTGTRRRRFS